MTYLETLKWGLNHIAENHRLVAHVDELETEGELYVTGNMRVPSIADIQMLCKDLGVEDECVEIADYGVDIFISAEWYETKANKPYTQTGFEMWKRSDVAIPE